MKIGDKILTELDKQRKPKKELAEYIGVKPASISDWSDSDNLRFWNVVKASEFLGLSLNYLAYGKEPTIPTEYKKLISSYQKLSPENQKMALRLMNTMYDVQMENEKRSEIKLTTIRCSLHKVSAGLGEALDDPENWEDISVPESDIVDRADFALRISGDSMEPKFFDDETVLIKQQDAVDIGDICIYIIENEGYIKKFGGDRLISLNEEYEDILFADYNPDDIKCCGLVLGKTVIIG